MLLRILIVDDNHEWSNVIQYHLRTGWLKDAQFDIECLCADNHSSAIDLIDQHMFDFAVIDLSIPYNSINQPQGYNNYPQQLWGGIAVLQAINRRYPIIVVTSYGTVDRVQGLANQYGVYYSFSKDNLYERFAEFYQRCSQALLKWRVEHATHQLTQRLVLNIDFQDNDQFRLRYTINGNVAGHAPQASSLNNRNKIIVQAHNVWQKIINNQPNIWRPEVQSIGEALYQQLATDPQWGGFIAQISNNASSLLALIRLNASAMFLSLPFEWLYHNQPLALDYAFTRHLTINRNRHLKSFYQWLHTKYQNQDPINVLLIGANSDGNIPQTETEVDELHVLYNDMSCLYGLRIHVTCLKGADAYLKPVRDVLQQRQFDIIHYAGHSHFNDQSGEFSHLILRNVDQLGVITASDLNSYLASHPPQVIFFSSCWSGHVQAHAGHYGDFTGIIPAVAQTQIPIIVGYRWTVNDTSARLLAHHFHQRLWHHLIPSQAMYEARHYITRHNLRRNDDTWLGALLITQNDD